VSVSGWGPKQLPAGRGAEGQALTAARYPAPAPQTLQVLGAKVRLMALQEALLELEVDSTDAVAQLCQVGAGAG
jgi:hypothetical protein